MPTAEAFATVFEEHRRVLRRHAGRMLRGTGHDPDDVLQDVYLRAHAALEGGVVPIEMRAWLLRLVRNACLDEMRRARSRPVGDVLLEAVPAIGEGLPDAVSSRHEAQALLGDIHRLPDRQKSVLVMSALDGLSHEEVADRLDTTVNTTRSLLARARENLRRTATAREASCSSVMDMLEESAIAGVRASELARRHLWSCHDCRAFQRDLRVAPSRLRKLASWSPWAVLAQLLGGGGKAAVGVCCALVVGGGAVTVPVVEHARHTPAKPLVAASTAPEAARAAAPKRTPKPARRATPPIAVVATPAATLAPTTKQAGTPQEAKPTKRRPARRRISAGDLERHQFQMVVRALTRKTPEQRQQMLAMFKAYAKSKPGSRERTLALRNLQREAFAPKAIATPLATATPAATPAAPIPTATPAPPEPTATPAPPVETPTPVASEPPATTPTPTQP